ncbi:hypothetical protein L1887_33633 [Cichorium endivia]|nr:hypothetical protein L1887_33633 [Cichorium endivia]
MKMKEGRSMTDKIQAFILPPFPPKNWHDIVTAVCSITVAQKLTFKGIHDLVLEKDSRMRNEGCFTKTREMKEGSPYRGASRPKPSSEQRALEEKNWFHTDQQSSQKKRCLRHQRQSSFGHLSFSNLFALEVAVVSSRLG